MNIEQLFFELLRVSIGMSGCLSKTPTNEEWKALYDIAKKQTLVGVCFAGVQKLVEQRQELEEMLYLTWMGMAAKIQQRNEVVNQQCVEVQRMLAEKGFRSCMFKGQANAALYTTNLGSLRQSGDIDIWIEGGRNRVIELVQKIAPTKEIRETHAQLNVFADTEVEAHYRPGLIRDAFRNKKLQAFFASCEEECFSNSINLSNHSNASNSSVGEQSRTTELLMIVAPTQRFNAVHQMLHIYHHLFDGGIGLRQVMDYYFVLCNLPRTEHYGVMEILKSLGVKRFTAALMCVLHEVFGLEESMMLCKPNEKDGAFLLDEIMQSGNFGHCDERNKKFDMGSYTQNFFGIIGKNLTYMRFAPWDWLMSPLWRIYHFAWRKWNGYV